MPLDSLLSPPSMPAKKMGRRGKGKRSKQARLLPVVTTSPNSQRILMTFSGSLALAESAAGAGVSYFYRLNSPYDPDASGVGTTAGGYSTWSALYLNYKVHRVSIRIQGTGSCASGAFMQFVTAPVASQAVVPVNPQLWKTIPYNATRTFTPQVNGGKTTFEITRSFDLAQVCRVTKSQYANDMDFSGAVGSNPARQVYLMTSVASYGSGSVATTFFAIQITYLVEWFNPVPMQL